MTEQAFHKTTIGEAFGDMESLAVADEHYHLRCGLMPCRCTCRACLMRSLRYCEEHHLTIPKDGGTLTEAFANADPSYRGRNTQSGGSK